MRYGIHYMYSHQSVARRNSFRDSSVGIYNMYGNGAELVENEVVANRGPSGYGIALKEANQVRLDGNRVLGNRVGLQLDNSPLAPPSRPEDATVFERNRFARNDLGVAFVGSGYGSVFLKNDFVDNWQQVSTSGLQSGMTVWTNNYWSDYRGVDPRRSGIGLIPYSADSVADAITDRFESFRLFSFGPAMLALEFAQKLIPWVESAPKAVDHAPAMEPRLAVEASAAPVATRLALAACSLVVLGLALRTYRRVLA
jgi:nitrous oxidase accessory protein